MYTCYQVVLVAEDGEYVQSEWQTEERAIDEANRKAKFYGDGQRLEIRPFNRSF